MYSEIITAINFGLDAIPVHVEADISEGMPCFEMVGFLASEVRESRDRVKTALKNNGYKIPAKHITVNLTPANIRKSGNGCDLPVAAAVLSALGYISDQLLRDYLVIGEIGLNGKILPVRGVLSVAILAKKEGYKGLIVPAGNKREASILSELQVIPVQNLEEFVAVCQSEFTDIPQTIQEEELWLPKYDVDFSEVYGQRLVKRACEIAISGMHNMLLIGPPGSGKTMIAKRIATILPELSRQEKLELSQIYSLCGLLDDRRIIINERPFRSPHHTATPQSISGGGRIPVPGEISLAHHGILYMDELTEFRRETIEVLREPMEEKQIHLSRVGNSITFPADFVLIASTNPCPCGFYPDMNRCTCSPQEVRLYMNRISKAMLNRIDLCVETQGLRYTDMMNKTQEESSAVIRERVRKAQAIQAARFQGSPIQFNSQMSGEMVEQYCAPDTETKERMPLLYEEYQLSARTYIKLLKTARTIADLDGSEHICWSHMEEALFYRSPDQKYWRRY